jgi:hypothetical protein
MPKPTCVAEHDNAPCGRPKFRRSTKWCRYDWLLNQPPSVRDSFSRWQAENDQISDPWPGDVACSACSWFTPPFYMGRGRRCVGCEGRAAHENKQINTYDLRRGDWDALNALQRGRCAVCRKRQLKKRLSTDHDHPTDEVRGLLCQWCNEQVLGSIGGDTATALPIARALVYYLEAHPTSGRWSPPEDQPEFGFPVPAVPAPKSLEESILGPPIVTAEQRAEVRLAPF